MKMTLYKVRNMASLRGFTIPNQFILTATGGILGNFESREIFQSYDSIIAVKTLWPLEAVQSINRPILEVQLDKTYWDYSKTTGKYRNIFLGESKKETQAKIDSGEYKLEDLN
jgi:hypothetical protein